jgi:hypothetical protein
MLKKFVKISATLLVLSLSVAGLASSASEGVSAQVIWLIGGR